MVYYLQSTIHIRPLQKICPFGFIAIKKKTVTQAFPRCHFIMKGSPDVFVFHRRILHTVVTQTGDSLSRGWMPRAGKRCGD